MIEENAGIINKIEAGKMAARYNILILVVFPVLAVLRAFGLLSFGWPIYLAMLGIAFAAAVASIAAVGGRSGIMLTCSTVIIGTLLVLLHRDGILVLIFPILIAMLYDNVKLISLSFMFSVTAYVLAEGTTYYLMEGLPAPGIISTGVIMLVQLLVLLRMGQTLMKRMKNKLESERVFMESISELLTYTKGLAEDMEVEEENGPQDIIDKVGKETGKILKYNMAIQESEKKEGQQESITHDLGELSSLSDKLHETLTELEEDLGKLTGALGGISVIIEDAKSMSAGAAVEEVAMKEKAPEISAMAAEIGKMAFAAKEAAERLREALTDIGKDGEKAVATVDKTYEAVYVNLELINRNVETLLKWFVLKRGGI